jgi:hypothetical protein
MSSRPCLLLPLALALCGATPVWSAGVGAGSTSPALQLLAESTGGFSAGPVTETAHGEDKPAAAAATAAPTDKKAAGAADKPAFDVESKEAETKQGGGWSNMMRSVTGFLGGPRATANEPRVTATIGIRGLSAAQLGSSNPDFNQVQKLEQQAVSQSDAMSFAQSGQLKPQNVQFIGPATR